MVLVRQIVDAVFFECRLFPEATSLVMAFRGFEQYRIPFSGSGTLACDGKGEIWGLTENLNTCHQTRVFEFQYFLNHFDLVRKRITYHPLREGTVEPVWSPDLQTFYTPVGKIYHLGPPFRRELPFGRVDQGSFGFTRPLVQLSRQVAVSSTGWVVWLLENGGFLFQREQEAYYLQHLVQNDGLPFARWSPDGRWLALSTNSHGASRRIQLWRWSRFLRRFRREPEIFALSAETILPWTEVMGGSLRRLDLPPDRKTEPEFSLGEIWFSPNGRYLVGYRFFWDLKKESSEELLFKGEFSFQNSFIYVAWHPDSRYWVSIDGEYQPMIWDLRRPLATCSGLFNGGQPVWTRERLVLLNEHGILVWELEEILLSLRNYGSARLSRQSVRRPLSS